MQYWVNSGSWSETSDRSKAESLCVLSGLDVFERSNMDNVSELYLVIFN